MATMFTDYICAENISSQFAGVAGLAGVCPAWFWTALRFDLFQKPPCMRNGLGKPPQPPHPPQYGDTGLLL